MLIIKCERFGIIGETDWIYAYNQTNQHSRICHKIGIKYYIDNYDDNFFDELAL